MPCRICTELEKFLHSAQQPDAPELLLGLTEAGKRNRDHQNREKILKAEANLLKHKKACTYGREQELSA